MTDTEILALGLTRLMSIVAAHGKAAQRQFCGCVGHCLNVQGVAATQANIGVTIGMMSDSEFDRQVTLFEEHCGLKRPPSN